jgi:F1F0 ATPase subunit 2
MNELWLLAPALAAGLSLGVFFFGGLWWTVTKVVSSDNPAMWLFGSMLLRTGVTLSGFYFVARDDWQRWLPCLFGFILARLVVKRLTQPRADGRHARVVEASHAP